jgi:uncharacterized protein
MKFAAFARVVCWLACVGALSLWSPQTASAQQQPSAASIAAANEIIDAKGSMIIFEPLVPGVIEQAKNVFLQTNPNLSKDLNEVAANLRKQLALRIGNLKTEAAKVYASRFSEQEMKEIAAFYKTPLGKKMVEEEPKIVDSTLRMAQDWANRLSEEVMSMFRAEMKKKGHTI